MPCGRKLGTCQKFPGSVETKRETFAIPCLVRLVYTGCVVPSDLSVEMN